MPMLELARTEYTDRTPPGYPLLIDEPDRGAVGILLDPSHSLSVLSDGQDLWLELVARSSRTDARSSAGREKYSGMPFHDRRAIPPDVTDQQLRNYVAELIARWNMQPNLIHITDT
jgi:hypothetical protein